MVNVANSMQPAHANDSLQKDQYDEDPLTEAARQGRG